MLWVVLFLNPQEASTNVACIAMFRVWQFKRRKKESKSNQIKLLLQSYINFEIEYTCQCRKAFGGSIDVYDLAP